MEEETAGSRRKRKEEAKLLKKQRIEESGGVRPRHEQSEESGRPNVSKSGSEGSTGRTAERRSTSSNGRNIAAPSPSATYASHRFGRVMETVPCRNQPRTSTVSIAIPGSIVANCQTRELKTQISGQIARAATIYHVDEIIVFDDKLSKGDFNRNQRSRPQSSARFDKPTTVDAAATFTTGGTVDEKRETEGESSNGGVDGSGEMPRSRLSDPHAFLARILQYCECPQYLRRHFFPMHPDLQFAGLLAPVDAPHHVRAEDRCSFREGVVLDKTHNGSGSLVNCGIRSRPVHIEQRLQPGIRCTVQLDPVAYGRPGQLRGKVVSPSTVTQTDGTYWGYTVRLASSIKAVFDDCPYAEKYDLTIGTSERGYESIDDPNFSLQTRRTNPSSTTPYRHALIVFGGIAGIEECVDADESLQLVGSASGTMFDKWINICSFQGSRTIRSEEAVLIALAKLSPFLVKAASRAKGKQQNTQNGPDSKTGSAIQLAEDEVSDESSTQDDNDGNGSD